MNQPLSFFIDENGRLAEPDLEWLMTVAKFDEKNIRQTRIKQVHKLP